MKRGGPLERRTPLDQRTPLSHTVPMQRSTLQANQGGHHKPAARPKPAYRPAVPARVLAVLKERSGGVCEIGLPGCAYTATDPAHRIKQGMGGRKGVTKKAHDVPSNVLHLCRWCHTICHQQPNLAYRRGWMLREHQTPIAEPVLYRGQLRWLADDGTLSTTAPPATAEEAT